MAHVVDAAPLLIVTGPPGAGTSTLSRLLSDRVEPSVLVEGDASFAFLARGAIARWLPEAGEQHLVVTTAAAAAAGRDAASGVFTVYDGVVGPWFLPTFVESAALSEVEYVTVLPSVERCIDAVATRTGHGFSDEAATRQMHRSFLEAEIDPRHVIEDPPDPDALADVVMDGTGGGRFRYRLPRR